MKTAIILFFVTSVALASSLRTPIDDPLRVPDEKHLRNIRQLTFGGENAEAYFSGDGKKLIFQSTRDNLKCDQIFIMNADGSDQRMVSTGKGRTTCGYIFPHQDKILYSSTHMASADCPPRPDYSNRHARGRGAAARANPGGGNRGRSRPA